MQYLGGKSRIAKQLAAVIDEYREPGQMVWDPFCGGLSMSVALSKKGPVRSSDACLPLISLYKAVQNGWDPPSEVSREEYYAAKSLPDTDPMKAFCGFGCSFGGKWFGGFTGNTINANSPLTYPQLARRNILKSTGLITTPECLDFLLEVPRECDFILYLDPPYEGTSEYNAVGAFDPQLFLQRVKQWSKHTRVFVSEYNFSLGIEIWNKTNKGTLGITHGAKRTERLYFIEKGSLT